MDDKEKAIDDAFRKQFVYMAMDMAFGKVHAIVQMCKDDRRHGVIVPTLGHMDKYISMGVQPSQVFLGSEVTRRTEAKIVIDEAYGFEF